MGKPRQYRLTVTEDHLRTLMRATEFFERIAMGQFREILDVADPHHKVPHEARETAEEHLMFARTRLMPELGSPNASWSIHSHEVHDDARVCYDFLQVVRHRLAWDRHPEGGFQVSFDKPLRSSLRLDLPVIEGVSEPTQESSSSVSLTQSEVRAGGTTPGSKPSGSKSKRGTRKVKIGTV